jgi:hypothetical protein
LPHFFAIRRQTGDESIFFRSFFQGFHGANLHVWVQFMPLIILGYLTRKLSEHASLSCVCCPWFKSQFRRDFIMIVRYLQDRWYPSSVGRNTWEHARRRVQCG